jgi:type VI secretion system secreted protein VgrG
MPDLIDTDRSAWVTIPLPEGQLVLESLSGNEGLSVPFVFELSLVGRNQDVSLSDLLGQPMTVHLTTVLEGERQFSGIVVHAEHGVPEGDYNRYRVTLCSWLSLLSYTTNCRIFQNKSAVDVIKEVFRDNNFSDFEDALSGNYDALDYCVQYRESDFNFVCRLMEQEGIYYFFKHEDSKHTLVLADGPGAHTTTPGYEEVSYKPPHEIGDGDHIDSWVVAQQIQSGSFATTDFDFTRPRANLMSQLAAPLGNAKDDFALYDYPGKFSTTNAGSERVKARLQSAQVSYAVVAAAGDTRGLGVGNLFTLADFPRDDQNKEYLITSASYHMHAATFDSGGGGGSDRFNASYTLIDSQVQFRSQPSTRKPRVEGPQTALVVGGSGDEITTDQYGRVKVQFHWDRVGQGNENSSCWVRVAQVWAGPGWGGIHIPRIGQEVIVDFLEGDPDRPIVTGRVYNADNMPPYTLPDNKTQSGIKSRSSQGGAPSNFNEIRFEDKKGSEELHVQAEKDETKLVKNNQTANVGVDRSLTVGNNETVSIGKDRTESVGNNESVSVTANQTLSVGANRTVSVGGNESVSIGANEAVVIAVASTHTVGAARAVTIGAAYQVTVGGIMSETVGAARSEEVAGTKSSKVGGASSETVGTDKTTSAGAGVTVSAGKAIGLSAGTDFNVQAGKNATIEATEQLTIACGQATIVLKKNGDITINGAKVQVTASGDLALKGSKLTGN